MTTLNLDYYRQRVDEELAAADRAVDPAIAQIHREMARRYRDQINGKSEVADGPARLAQPLGVVIAEPRPVFT